MKDRITVEKLFFFALTLLVSLMCFKSATSVLASLNFYGANNYIEQWQKGDNVPTDEELNSALKYANDALGFHKNLALYSDTLSTVLQWKAIETDDHTKSMELLSSAEVLNLHSLTKRPAWPVTWANLAYIKWLKSEIDDDFILYLNNASLYGPNTPEVHIALSSIGLAMSKQNVRQFLELKELVQQHTMAGLSHSKSRAIILETIANTKTKPMVCAWLKQADAPKYMQLKCA